MIRFSIGAQRLASGLIAGAIGIALVIWVYTTVLMLQQGIERSTAGVPAEARAAHQGGRPSPSSSAASGVIWTRTGRRNTVQWKRVTTTEDP